MDDNWVKLGMNVDADTTKDYTAKPSNIKFASFVLKTL